MMTPKSKPTHAKKNYYAVTCSKANSSPNVGIYTDWTSCAKNVLHVSGGRQQGTETLEEAIEILKINGLASPVIHHKGETYKTLAYKRKFLKLPMSPR